MRARKTYLNFLISISLICLCSWIVGCGKDSSQVLVLDPTAPQVLQILPQKDSPNVPINSSFLVTFSKPMDISTLSLKVEGAGAIITTTATSSTIAPNVFLFSPGSELQKSTNYTATLAAKSSDITGKTLGADHSWKLTTTTEKDITPPSIKSITPAQQATEVTISSHIVIELAEDIDVTSISTQAVSALHETGTWKGKLDYDPATRKVTITPSAPLKYKTNYSIIFPKEIRDLSGNYNTIHYIYSFKTVAEKDTTPPTVKSHYPAHLAKDVLPDTKITVTFSESMKAGTINSNTFKVTLGDKEITGTIAYDETTKTATFTPQAQWLLDSAYAVRVYPGKEGVTDLAGIPLVDFLQFGFITTVVAPTPTPEGVSVGRATSLGVTEVTPTAGSSSVPVTTKITVTFSNKIFKDFGMTVSDPDGNVVRGEVTQDVTQRTFTLSPSGRLKSRIRYTVNISKLTLDESGARLGEDYTFYFSTTHAFEMVAAGLAHALALDNGGNVWSWGFNERGQLGDGTLANRPTPKIVLTNAKFIAAGELNSYAILNNGRVMAWGNNEFGQLGDGGRTNSSIPKDIPELNGATAIAPGEGFCLALYPGGAAKLWGLYPASYIHRWRKPISQLALKPGDAFIGALAIGAGHEHMIYLKIGGTVWTFGNEPNGQLGIGKPDPPHDVIVNNKTEHVSTLENIVSVAAGYSHSLALRSDGTLFAWGNNSSGQIGDGTSSGSGLADRPLPIAVLTGVKSMAGGGAVTYAIKTDGTLWSWGIGSLGLLGDEIRIDRATPAQVAGLKNVKMVASGGTPGGDGFSIAIFEDGTIRTWGSNSNGQIGNGTADTLAPGSPVEPQWP